MNETSVRHAWIDASAGVAGDMLMAAFIDAGADISEIQSAVDLVIPGAVELSVGTVNRAGLRASKVDVKTLVEDRPHRTWRSIRTMLTEATLPDPVKRSALAVFGRLAEAEGYVHGIVADDVHFHEIGAFDSIADIVGVCAALHQLGIETVSVGSVAVGSGRIRAAHGDIPVPGPAVVHLARGWRVHAGGDGELATPTGLALITTLADCIEEMPAMLIERDGCGAGTKDFTDRPNVTRAMLGRRAPGHGGTVVALTLIEANVDDMDPRIWPGVIDNLLRAGASDAWLTPILMKKGRPAHTLSVLCPNHLVASLRGIVFAETTTLGVREHLVQRFALSRCFVYIDVAGDRIAIRLAHDRGVIVQAMPEFADLASSARRRGLAERLILDQAKAVAAARGLAPGQPLPSGMLGKNSAGARIAT